MEKPCGRLLRSRWMMMIGPNDFAKIAPTYGTNIFKHIKGMYGETLDFQ